MFKKIATLLALGLVTTVSLTAMLSAEETKGTWVKEEFSCSVALADKKELEANIASDAFDESEKKNFKTSLKTSNRLIATNNCKEEK